MSSSESEDQSSVLGRKEHWEEAYAAELATFRDSQGADAGEVWFGEDTQATMVELVARMVDASSLPHGAVGGRDAWRVLDLGCGNGALCVALARAGFTTLLGVDYVDASVQLSREVAAAAGFPHIRFQVDNVLELALEGGSADLVVDKGTLDAIGLAVDGASARKCYVAAAARLLPERGLLVVTSCNSTAEELLCEITEAGWFAERDRVRTYPVFRFAGVEGTRVATLAFARTARPL